MFGRGGQREIAEVAERFPLVPVRFEGREDPNDFVDNAVIRDQILVDVCQSVSQPTAALHSTKSGRADQNQPEIAENERAEKRVR